jgi:hypothetical protein
MASIGRILAAAATGGASELTLQSGAGAVRGVDEVTGAREERERTKRLADEQAAAVKAHEDELAKRKAQEESDEAAGAARSQARARQRSAAAAARGRRDTLVTGPLGLPEDSLITAKSLLGI